MDPGGISRSVDLIEIVADRMNQDLGIGNQISNYNQ